MKIPMVLSIKKDKDKHQQYFWTKIIIDQRIQQQFFGNMFLEINKNILKFISEYTSNVTKTNQRIHQQFFENVF